MNEKDWLDSKEFYNFMQVYRVMTAEHPMSVVYSFEAVKDAIRRNFKEPDKDNHLYVGDLFTHCRSGNDMVCTAITKRESGTTVELSPYVRDQK